jgi:hypothetical protein
MIAANSSIDYNGLLVIKFNQDLFVPEIIQYALDLQSNISAKKVVVSVPAGFTFTSADYGFVYEDTNVIYDYGTL